MILFIDFTAGCSAEGACGRRGAVSAAMPHVAGAASAAIRSDRAATRLRTKEYSSAIAEYGDMPRTQSACDEEQPRESASEEKA